VTKVDTPQPKQAKPFNPHRYPVVNLPYSVNDSRSHRSNPILQPTKPALTAHNPARRATE